MDNKSLNIAVLGAGNGGQAIAGYCAMRGYKVCLYNRTLEKIHEIRNTNKITLCGQIEGTGTLHIVTDDMQTAVEFADIIMIATTANAHKELALKMSPFLKDNQIIILNPGRTGGFFEFQTALKQSKCNKNIYLAEAQTLMYACRKITEGLVNIIGIKEKVLIASNNLFSTNHIINKIKDLYTCFIPAKSVLQTSLENIGAIFHPSVILFNAAAIERGENFYFYRDMTPHIAEFILQLDQERINIGKAFDIELISAEDWVAYAYPNIEGENLCERMKNNPAYYDIIAPTTIYSRQLLEDIPSGLVPMTELARIANIKIKLMPAIISICSALLKIDFWKTGRNLASLGLEGCNNINDILEKIDD